MAGGTIIVAIWSVVLGAAIGVALGIVVSVATDIPLAPEAGLLLGGLVGWFSATALVANPRARRHAGYYAAPPPTTGGGRRP